MTVIAQDDHLYGRPSPHVSEIAIVSQTKVKKIDWNEMVWTNEETLSKQHENVDNTRTAYALILGCMLNKQNRSIKYQFCLKSSLY